ncbi:MAG: ATP-binding protein, partial [Opitutae bacterium]|nr:ATP-binding protein [Opitutae bacterium]
MDMTRKLAEATERNHLPRLIRTLTKMRLLVLDKVGYLEISKPQASLLFQVISMRYESGLPIILTSNKAFGDWLASSPQTPSWPPQPWTDCYTDQPSSTYAAIPTGSKKSAWQASP